LAVLAYTQEILIQRKLNTELITAETQIKHLSGRFAGYLMVLTTPDVNVK
jgi:hypothetical protein